MKLPIMRWLASTLRSVAALLVVTAWFGNAAYAQGHSHGGGASLSWLETFTGISHGVTLLATVFLVGVVAFTVLVWLPASRSFGVDGSVALLFSRGAWAMFALLVVAGLVELSLYTVEASGESFSLGLFETAVFGTRVGHIWLTRLGFAFATALVASWAAQEGKKSYWGISVGLGSVLLVTLTQLSHAAAEGRFLPFLADWLHVIAGSVWMGGLIGFPMLMLGPLRAMPDETRMKLLGRTVRRFSKVATLAVTAILITGTYAALIHVPSFSALIGTVYGRALVMKLGLVAFMFPIAAINLMDRGEGPFGRMVGMELALALGVFVATGFLSSLPPP